MRYWPISILAQSSLMPPAYAPEVARFDTALPSEGAFYACFDVARRTAGVDAPNTAVIETVNAPERCVYVGFPDAAEWLGLERISVMETKSGHMFIMVAALH
jgi:hypothetical protein